MARCQGGMENAITDVKITFSISEMLLKLIKMCIGQTRLKATFNIDHFDFLSEITLKTFEILLLYLCLMILLEFQITIILKIRLVFKWSNQMVLKNC